MVLFILQFASPFPEWLLFFAAIIKRLSNAIFVLHLSIGLLVFTHGIFLHDLRLLNNEFIPFSLIIFVHRVTLSELFSLIFLEGYSS